MQENRCVCCNAIIPEGFQVCPNCNEKHGVSCQGRDLIILHKEEEKKKMPFILSFLVAAGKYILICLAWMALEKHFYGEVQPRIVDDIIGLVLFFYILKGEIL